MPKLTPARDSHLELAGHNHHYHSEVI